MKRLTIKFVVILILALGLAACSAGIELSHDEVQIYAGQNFNPLSFIKSDIEDESKVSITNNIRKDIPGTYEVVYDLNGSKKTLMVKVLVSPIVLKNSKIVIEKGTSFEPKNALSHGSQQNDIKIVSNVDVDKPGEYIVIYAFEGIEKTLDVVVESLEIDLIEPSISIDLGSKFASMDYIKSNFPSSKNLKIENNVDLTKPGNYSVIYSYGENSKTLSVKVNDVSPFLRTPNVTLKYGSTFDPKSYLIESDRSNDNIQIDNKVDTSKAGTYLVTYKLGTVSKTLSVTVSNPPTTSTPVAPTNPTTPTQPSNPTTPTQPSTPTVNKLSVISLTSPVTQNEHATITVKGTPNKSYSITVMYKSGPSTAAGLEPKIADSNGVVSWTWKIGARTSEGKWKITISGDGQTVSTYITVQ